MAHLTLAQRIGAAFDTLEIVEPDEGELPTVRDAAEAGQDALIALLGPVSAYKLGATIPAVRQDLQLDRFFFGAIPATRVFANGASIPPHLARQRGVECEYAFCFGHDLTAADLTDAATLWSAIDVIRPAIEIPGTRFSRLGVFKGIGMIVDDGSVGTLVLGEPVRVPDPAALTDAAVTLTIGGREAVVGSGRVIDDGPFGPVLEFARQATARGHAIRAGQVVVTGSCTGYVVVEPDQEIVAQFSALGHSVSARFAPAS